MAEKCAAEGCEQEAIVGVGAEPRWVCLEHFTAYLAFTLKPVRDALAAAEEISTAPEGADG